MHTKFMLDAGPVAQRSPWLWPLAGCGAVLLLVVLGSAIDQADELRQQAEQAAFDAGRRAGHAEMVATAEAAWEMAHAEATRCSASKAAR